MSGPINLADRRKEIGKTMEQMIAESGVSYAMFYMAEKLRLPKNHPYAPKVAMAYGVPLEEFLKLQIKAKPLAEQQVKRLAARFERNAQRKSGKALVKYKGPRNGVTVVRGRPRGNQLQRKFDQKVLRTARGLCTHTNMSLMQGQSHTTLEGVPAEHLGVILNDWLALHGVKPLVLTENYSDIFD